MTVKFNTIKLFLCFIFKVILALGDYMNVQCHACIGGTNIGEDMRKLDYGQHVVSGTPGRVFGTHTVQRRAFSNHCANGVMGCQIDSSWWTH